MGEENFGTTILNVSSGTFYSPYSIEWVNPPTLSIREDLHYVKLYSKSGIGGEMSIERFGISLEDYEKAKESKDTKLVILKDNSLYEGYKLGTLRGVFKQPFLYKYLPDIELFERPSRRKIYKIIAQIQDVYLIKSLDEKDVYMILDCDVLFINRPKVERGE